ncbi:MAG TPA: septum formation initiator family protein [Mollicutes bacterium]|nr:septum formation initiator family protein [Mollicutes bacterium]
MPRKISKKTKRRLFTIFLITLTIATLFLINVGKMFFQIMEKRKEEAFLIEELKRLENEEAYLKVEVEKLNDPDYVARYARERYLYSKDGEITIRIP